MKIVDMNIISKFCSGEIQVDLTDQFYVTPELQDEIGIYKAAFPSNRAKLSKIKFIDIERYRYRGGGYFDEAKYLFHYKNLINKYTNIISFYGLKGFGDISILAAVATVLHPENPSLFDTQETVEVITNDRDLKDALAEEFKNHITISDPIVF